MKERLSRRITAYFLIILVVTILFSVTWNDYSTRRSIIEMEKSLAEGCSRAITALLEHSYRSDSNEDASSESSFFLWNAVRNFCRGFNQDALYIYTVEPGSTGRRMLLAVLSEETDVIPPDRGAELFPLPDHPLTAEESALLSGRESLVRIDWRSGFARGALWISLLPVSGDAGPFFLGMEYSLGLEDGQILSDFWADILLPNIALGVAFLVMIQMFRKRVAMPIRLISDRMKRFAQNSSKLPEPLEIHSRDEIGEIASSFNAMTKEITSYIANIEKLTKERVEINVQMDIARRIQNGLVPEKRVLKDEAFCVSAMTRPAKAVGGDFYDCFRLKDGAVCILMGDVSGKGITGALFMAVIKTMIREKLALGLSPAQALNSTNEQLLLQNPEGLFATVFVAILDQRTGDLRYANAGHTRPVLLGNGARFLTPDTGIALGLFDDAGILDEHMLLSPGQGLFLYTDGLPDVLNAQRLPFGTDRLLAALREIPRGPDPAETVLQRICAEVDAYREGVEPFDDMALLTAFRSSPLSGGELCPLPVSLSSFQAIKKAVFALTGDTPAAKKALLACDEALTNIVQYSGASRLAFRCSRQGDKLCVVFSDDGIPFDPTAAFSQEKPFEQLDSGGMGLILIRQTASETRYVREDGMNVFTLAFSL